MGCRDSKSVNENGNIETNMKSEYSEEEILKIVKERQVKESELHLSKRLYHYIEFSRWGNRDKIKMSDFLDGSVFEPGCSDQTAKKVDFKSNQKKYSILLYEKKSLYSSDYDYREEMLEIYCDDKKKVFSSTIKVKLDEVPIFKTSELVSFLPNGWLDDLLLILDEEDKLDKKRQEEDQKRNLKKLKNNFID